MCTNDIYVHIYTPWYSLLTAPLRTTNCASLAILDTQKPPPTSRRRGLSPNRVAEYLTLAESELHASGFHAV